MSGVVDVHTHYLAIGRFPEIAGVPGLTPDVRPVGTLRTTIEGVSSLVYPEFLDAERLSSVAVKAGIDVRLVSATMQLNQLMVLLDLPSLEIARRINDEGAELMRRFPGRTVAMASVCPFESGHLAELHRPRGRCAAGRDGPARLHLPAGVRRSARRGGRGERTPSE